MNRTMLHGSVKEHERTLLEAWNARLASYLVGNSAVLCLYILIGVVGNLLVIFIYTCRMKGPKDDRYFIPYLAVMDLVACVFGASYALSLNMLPVGFQGDYLCKALWFSNQAATLIASFMLLVIAVQRYLKVCQPFKVVMTLYWKRLAVFIVISVGILLAAPCWVFYGEIEVRNDALNITGYRCSEKRRKEHRKEILAYNAVLFVVAVGGILCISGLYVLVGSTIYRQVRYRKRVSVASANKCRKSSNENSSGVQSDANKRYLRDSLDLVDLDSPGFDSSMSADAVFDKCADDENRSSLLVRTSENNTRPSVGSDSSNRGTSTYGNALAVPSQEEEPKRRSFTEELERPLKAIKQQIPKVRSHFSNHKCSWMFMLITIVFITAFIPRITLMVLESIDRQFWNKLSDKQIVFYLFLYRLYLITNITNPFFYGLFDKGLRRELRSLCCKKKARKI